MQQKIIFLLLFLGFSSVAAKQDAVSDMPQFVIIITSYNNAAWYQKNLSSVFAQTATNYRVIYVDDCSPDGTGALVQDFVAQCGMQEKVTLVTPPVRRDVLANTYHAVHMCKDHEIAVILDGDDWFDNPHVIERLTREYENPDVWVTYGQYMYYPYEQLGCCMPIPAEVIDAGQVRQWTGYACHLRTFRAWLFKQIKLKDLLYDGTFFAMTGDKAIIAPLLEMAGHRYRCIEEVLYQYNCKNPLSHMYVNNELQMQMEKVIFAKTPYTRLARACNQAPVTRAGGGVDIVALAGDGDEDALQQRLEQQFAGWRTVSVVCKDLACKQQLLDLLNDKAAEHILLITNEKALQRSCIQRINLTACAQALEQTFARACYFGYAEQPIEKTLPLTNDLVAWQYQYNPNVADHSYATHMVLCRKETLLQPLRSAYISTVADVQDVLGGLSSLHEEIGMSSTYFGR